MNFKKVLNESIRFRNTWSWGCSHEGCSLAKPKIVQIDRHSIECHHQTLPPYIGVVDDVITDWNDSVIQPKWMFTENETNATKLFGASTENRSKFVKDAFHRFIIEGDMTLNIIWIVCF